MTAVDQKHMRCHCLAIPGGIRKEHAAASYLLLVIYCAAGGRINDQMALQPLKKGRGIAGKM